MPGRCDKIGITSGYMIERERIQRGTKLKLLRQRDGVTSGTLGNVDTVREENWGTAWGFSVYWDDYRKKHRYSLFFSEADLKYFELVEGAADLAVVELRVFPAAISVAVYRSGTLSGDRSRWHL